MADQPEYAPKPTISPLRRIRAWAIMLAFCGVLIAMTGYGFVLFYQGLQPKVALDLRVEMLLGATALLFPAWLVVKSYLLRRWQTGRWNRTREEAMKQVQQCRVRASTRIRPVSWFQFGYRWGNFNAFDRTAPRWKRIFGWTALVLYALSQLAVVGLALICVGAAFADDNTITETVVFLAIAGLISIWPVVLVRKGLQRRREFGTLRVSAEELQEAVAYREAWQESERAKPLGAKITSIFVVVCALTYFWIRNVVYHTGHKEADWITADYLYFLRGIRRVGAVSAAQE